MGAPPLFADRKQTALLLLLVLAPLLVLWPGVFAGQALGPWDQIKPMLGDGLQTSPRAWDVLQADGALQFTVWRDLVFSSWRVGEIPLYNPYQLAGQPLLPNSQSAPFYPFHILLGISGLPTPLAIVLLAWLHLAIAALGVRALALRLGASPEAAALGGVLCALSPFMVAWTALPSVTTTVCWIPVALNLLLKIFQRPTLPVTGQFALATACLLLGGHLQFAFYGLLALLLTGIWLLFSHLLPPNPNSPEEIKAPLPKSLLSALAGAALAVALASVQILPTLQFSRDSHRQADATAEGYAAYVASAVKPFELPAILAPGLLGLPGQAEADSPENFRNPAYWPLLVKPGANFAESALYLGPVLLLGLLMLPRDRDWRKLGAIASIGTLGFLLALGTGLNGMLYYNVPGFAATGSPGRAAVLFVLAACVLAAVAFPRANDQPNPKAPAYSVIALFVIGVAAILASQNAATLETWIPGASVATPAARRMVETLPTLLIGLLCAAGAWFFWVKKGQILLALALALAGHLVAVPTQFLAFGPAPKPAPQQAPDPATNQEASQTNLRRAYVNLPWDFFRATNALYPPNTSTLARVQDLAGYDSLLHRDTVAMLREVNNGEDPAPPINGNMMFVKPGFDPAALAEAGVTEVWSRVQLPQLTTPPLIKDNYVVYDLPGPGLVSDPLAEGKVTRLSTSGFTIRANGPGPVIVRFRALPGLEVAAGQATLSAMPESPWIQLDLSEPGEQEVTVRYNPPGFATGVNLAIPALLATLALLAAPVLQRRRQPVPNETQNH